MFSVTDLSKKSKFSGISFGIEKGVLGVLSASLQEKTDFCKLVSGLIYPDGGEITGSPKTVFIAKSAPLPDTLTVAEYIGFICDVSGKKEIPEKVSEFADAISKKIISSLSDTERILLAFNSSLISNPDVLIADEPLYGLEDDEKNAIIELICDISENIPVIITSSSPSDCQGICSHLLALSKGNQLSFGTTEEVSDIIKQNFKLTMKVKGAADKISALEKELNTTAVPGEKANTYEITVDGISPDEPEALQNIKKAVRRSGVALLMFKPENEELRALFEYLSEKETELKAKKETEKPQKLTKVTGSLLSFSHEDENEFEEDDEKDDSSDDDRMSDGESTLFSSDNDK